MRPDRNTMDNFHALLKKQFEAGLIGRFKGVCFNFDAGKERQKREQNGKTFHSSYSFATKVGRIIRFLRK